jgi:hypothetical protein
VLACCILCFMTATVLVTGGAGFIGSHAVEALLAAGEQVRVLDDFSTGRRENLSGMNGALEVIDGDVREPETVAAAMCGCDRVLHLAAIASVARSFDDPATTEAVNVDGTANVLAAAQAGRERAGSFWPRRVRSTVQRASCPYPRRRRPAPNHRMRSPSLLPKVSAGPPARTTSLMSASCASSTFMAPGRTPRPITRA